MLRVHRLYSEPSLFEPIEFTSGVNLVMGVTNTTSEKTNGVGKSLCIEFLNYGLLKDYSASRLSLIPEKALPPDTLICLDFSVGDTRITTKRSIRDHDSPTLVVNGVATNYYNMRDACQQLETYLFGPGCDITHPSFRSMLSLLVRDERSEFKSIVNPFDTAKPVPPDYAPHLYLLGIDSAVYADSKKLWKEADTVGKVRSKLKKDVESLTGKSFSDARADANELEGQVQRIKTSLDDLESSESFELIKDEIIELENDLQEARATQSALKVELSRIALFKGDNYIDDSEVASLFNRYKASLGDMVSAEITAVTAFKKKIDRFQETLLDSRRQSLVAELQASRSAISALDARYQQKLRLVDQQGVLKTLKVTVMAYQKKLEDLAQLSTFIKQYDDSEAEGRELKRERIAKILQLQSLLVDADATVRALEQTILAMHEYVMGNRHSSFKVNTTESKDVVVMELRIHDDGSHSVDREKVFFYDMALLLTDEIADRHPGFLVHDNIFDVDQDTLLKSLDYLAVNASRLDDRQYILTLNSDRFREEDKAVLKLDLDDRTRARFTKDERFLGREYQEK